MDKRRVPPTINDAKFSIPFSVAVGGTKGKVSNTDFTPEGLQDAKVLKMAQRVKMMVDAN
jgi:2-methylcitrate dehydratase PrpD